MKDSTLLIGITIYKLLSEDENISKSVGNKIFPIVAEGGTNRPFIIFNRNSITDIYSKDGIYRDTVNVTFNIVTQKYLEGCNIAVDLRNLLDNKTYNDDNINITQMRLTNISENYQDGDYVQQLTFEFKIR